MAVGFCISSMHNTQDKKHSDAFDLTFKTFKIFTCWKLEHVTHVHHICSSCRTVGQILPLQKWSWNPLQVLFKLYVTKGAYNSLELFLHFSLHSVCSVMVRYKHLITFFQPTPFLHHRELVLATFHCPVISLVWWSNLQVIDFSKVLIICCHHDWFSASILWKISRYIFCCVLWYCRITLHKSNYCLLLWCGHATAAVPSVKRKIWSNNGNQQWQRWWWIRMPNWKWCQQVIYFKGF